MRFFDTGHFALETHRDEIASAIRAFLVTARHSTSRRMNSRLLEEKRT